MKFTIKIILLIASIVFYFPALADNAKTVHPKTPIKSQSVAKHDGIILEVLSTVNKNEIKVAELALQKTKNEKVKAYARLMKKDHSTNLNETLALSKKIKSELIESKKSAALKENGKNLLQKLKNLSNKKFDESYMKAMVEGHKAVLNMINNELLKMVQNNSLKKHLIATRDKVKQHLKKAEDLKNNL